MHTFAEDIEELIWHHLLANHRRECAPGGDWPHLSRNASRCLQHLPNPSLQPDDRCTAPTDHAQRPGVHLLLRTLQVDLRTKSGTLRRPSVDCGPVRGRGTFSRQTYRAPWPIWAFPPASKALMR